MNYSRSLAVRCMHEAHANEANSFITLTYADKHLPVNNSLDPRHFTLFRMRLRNEIGPFRYFQCGEYGTKLKRPHFHAIIFGHDFRADRILYKHQRDGHSLYNSPTLDKAWGHKGHAVIGSLSFQSAAYVARYIFKKQKGSDLPEYYERWDPTTGEVTSQPEFATWSRRPGLGSDWYEKYGETAHNNDFIMMEGTKVPIPRYYDVLLGRKDPDKLEAIKKMRVARAEANQSNLTTEKLNIREYILRARLSQLERSLE